MELSVDSKEFIAQIPFVKENDRLAPVWQDKVAAENAAKCATRFGVPKEMYFSAAEAIRERYHSVKLTGAFMAGFAVGWFERGAHDKKAAK